MKRKCPLKRFQVRSAITHPSGARRFRPSRVGIQTVFPQTAPPHGEIRTVYPYRVTRKNKHTPPGKNFRPGFLPNMGAGGGGTHNDYGGFGKIFISSRRFASYLLV